MGIYSVWVPVTVLVHEGGFGVIVDAVAIPITPEGVVVRMRVLEVADAIAIPVFVFVVFAVVVPVVVESGVPGVGVGSVGDAVAIGVVLGRFGVVIDAVAIPVIP